MKKLIKVLRSVLAWAIALEAKRLATQAKTIVKVAEDLVDAASAREERLREELDKSITERLQTSRNLTIAIGEAYDVEDLSLRLRSDAAIVSSCGTCTNQV